MVSFLQIENLTKSYGDRLLFADVTFGIYQGDKIGLVAKNGTGKSTFLRILCGEEDADSGSVISCNGLKIGFLPQIPDFGNARTFLEAAMPHTEGDDAWSAPDKTRRMLSQFNLHNHEGKIDNISGGEAKRLALAKVLLSEPDMLVLDEPTNHLDISMIEWLEGYLSKRKITLLMVTHDRYFLDNVCNKIIELDRNSLFVYEGNYDYYLQKRQERHEQLGSELARVKNLLRTELEWMRRQPQARGSKAKYRIDNFYELEKKSHINLQEKNVALGMKSSYIGSKIFEAHGVSKSFGDKVILKDWSYTFARYEKVGIVGENGVGKSTFIKMLLGELKPDFGYFDVGETVKWGYYSQEGMVDFDENKKVIDAVKEITETVVIDEKTRLGASQFLQQFLFTPEDQQKYIYRLSGGERRRLYLATVLIHSPNFLILDEPTNDLDIVTLTVLEDFLVNFKGCVIIVSHDRFFLDRIVDHLFVFKGDGVVKDFPGDYSTYRHCLAQEEAIAKRNEVQSVKESSQNGQKSAWRKPKKKPSLTFKEQREMESLEKELESLAIQRSELEESMSSGKLSSDEIIEAGNKISQVIEQIDLKELRLLELMEKAE
ncbi:MAG: ABC-F family ATP-binding cassette domain-containing protein [Prevotella sp.]|nr:ABC-F family ATP-binding cassette domain-containing protein [Bacteroides sp.]MCM1366352.1 ABC-F family ATP-binding cassette domain-containing protein [Prevotella sp.]MCM1436290.1 ABC-F family ATP-binding cassette domain-containing protein [Prevotella sp.]